MDIRRNRAETRGTPWFALAVATLAAVAAAIAPARGAERDAVRAFYFGNSLLENATPGMHPLLGESAGKKWVYGTAGAAGVPAWVHMNRMMDPQNKHSLRWNAFENPEAMVVQLFAGPGLSHVTTEMWGNTKFDKPLDVGDVNSCAYLIDRLLQRNPQGRAYIYTPWAPLPGVKEVRERIAREMEESLKRKGMQRDEIMKYIKETDAFEEELDPLRKAFDYEAAWLTTDYIFDAATVEERERFTKYSGGLRTLKNNATIASLAQAAGVPEDKLKADMERLRITEEDLKENAGDGSFFGQFVNGWPHTHSRAHAWAVMKALTERYPEMWKQKRLGIIPAGDVFLEIDRRIKAGDMPGLVSAGEFICNGVHIRGGLPRYTVAATFYAVLFEADPHELDWKPFDDRENYEKSKERFGEYVHMPDVGVLLDITPERAKTVNDAIWEVVTHHPYVPFSDAYGSQ